LDEFIQYVYDVDTVDIDEWVNFLDITPKGKQVVKGQFQGNGRLVCFYRTRNYFINKIPIVTLDKINTLDIKPY
jgi:hypothetical protein